MGLSIGPTIGVDGAEKFRLAFQQMAASAGMLQSQMDAVTASFRANDSAMKTNKAVAEQLTKQVDQQQRLYDKAVEGFQKAKQATYDAAQAVAQSKKEYEAAVPVLEIFKRQYEEAVAIEQRQAAVVEDVRTKLQEATAARDELAQSLANGEAPLVNEVNLHEQLIAKGSELVNKYNEAKTAYDTFSAELTKNSEALAKAEEKHREYSSQIDASKQRLSELKNQQAILTTAVKDSTAEFEKAKKKVEEEAEAHGYYSKEASAARAERDAYNKILKQFTTELNSVIRAINNEQKTLADLEKKDDDAQKETEKLSGTVKDLTEITEVAKGELDGATDALNKEKDAAADANQKLEEYRKQNGENNKELQTANEKVDELTKALDKEEKELSENKKETEAHKKALNGAKKEVEQYSKNIDNAEKRLDVARVTAQKWGDVVYTSKAKLIELQHALEEAGNKLSAWADDCVNSGEAISRVGEGISKVLSPFTALTAFGVKGALTFTDALAKISTIADTTKVSLDDFGEGIKQIASDTGFATDDIAAAVYQALSAAVDTSEALKFTAGAADLARAGFLDMFGSVDVLTTILNSYHMKVDDVAHISDVLVKVQDKGKTTVNELASQMGAVIPTAAQYGIKLEDLGAAYVVLTKQGINTAKTTTYLRSAFTELEKEGSDASNALVNATGKTFVQLLANGKNLGEIMQILKDYVKGDEEAFIHLFGNIRTASGAMSLANTSAGEYAAILDEVSNSSGQAANNVAKLQTPSLKLKKAWEQLKTTGLDLGQQMLAVLIPYIEKGVAKIKEFTDKVKKLQPSTKRMIALFVMVSGSIGPIVTGFGKAVIGLGKFAKAMSTLFKISAPLVGKLSLVAGGILAVAGAFAVTAIKINEQNEARKAAIKALHDFSEEEKEQMAVNKQLIDQSVEIRQSADEQAKSRADEAAKAQTLLGTLRGLYDGNGKIIEGNKLAAEQIKGQLAEALGVEVEYIDDLIEDYGIYGRAIDDVVQKKIDAALADSYLQSYVDESRALKDLAKERDDYFSTYQAAVQDVTNAFNDMKTAEENFETIKRTSDDTAEIERYGKAWADSIQNYQAAQQHYDEAYNHYSALNEEIATGTQELDDYMSKILQASGQTKEQAEKTIAAAGGSLSEFKDTNEGMFESMHTTVTKIMDDATTTFDTKFAHMEKTSAESGEKTVGAFGKSLSDGAEDVKKGATDDADKAVEGLDTATNRAPYLAQNFLDSFINTITAPYNLQRMFEATFEVGKKGNEGFEAATKQGSPSRVWMEYADNNVDGFLIGAKSRLGDMYSMGEAMGAATVPTAWASNYSRLPDTAYGTTNNTRNISAPIAVNVNVNGSVDDPNVLADVIEQRLVEKIINNERVFA